MIPNQFLFRVAHPCHYVKNMPLKSGDDLLDLSDNCVLDNFAGLDGKRNFADVRIAWNELGIGFQVEVHGKQQAAQGDIHRPLSSDGATLWLDTRDARTSHRATRYCHQFHFLPAGNGPDRDEPGFVQGRIHRALQDAPLCSPNSVPFKARLTKGGYRIDAFLPANVLHGFDPDQNPRLGIYYAVRDSELGEQVLAVGSDFPYAEDPSLWAVLELVKSVGSRQKAVGGGQ